MCDRNCRYTSFAAIVAVLFTSGCRSADTYVQRGNKLAEQGKTEEATLNYRKAIQKDSNYGPAYLRLGELALSQRDQMPEAYRMLKQAVALMPDNDEARVKLADISLAAYATSRKPLPAMYAGVREAATYLLSKDKNSFDGLRLSGSIAMLDRKPAEAVSLFKRANDVKPWQPGLILELVQAHRASGDQAEAERLGKALLDREKTYAPMYDVLYAHYMRNKMPAAAEEVLKAKVQHLPADPGPVFELARHYARTGDEAKMSGLLDSFGDNVERFPNGHIEVAEFYTNLGQPETALRHLQSRPAASTAGQHVLRERAKANALLSLKRYDDARNTIETLLKQHPDDLSAQAVNASLLLHSSKSSDRDRAIDSLRTLNSKNPRNVDILLQLAEGLRVQGEYDGAASAYMQALKLSNSPRVRVALAQLRLEQRQPTTALQLANEVLSVQSSNREAQLVRAAATAATGNIGQARTELSRMPRLPDVVLQLAVISIVEKRYKEAEKALQELTAGAPSHVLGWKWLAECYWLQGDRDKALLTLDTFIRKHPESIPMRVLLATRAVEAGRPQVAVDQYAYLVGQDPGWPDGHFNLGRAYAAVGDRAAAGRHLQKAADLAPKKAVIWLALADNYRSSNQPKDAEAALRRAVQLEPANAVAKNNLAFVISENGGNIDEAIAIAREAVQIDRKQPAFSDTLGLLYLKKNDVASALQVFRVLSTTHPENPSVQYHYGETLLRNGDREGAKAALNAALSHKPDGNDQARIKQLLAGL